MAYLDVSKFNPALRSKVTQVNRRIDELDALVEDVFADGKLDATKVANIKAKIAQFDTILISNADGVVKGFMKKDVGNIEEIKKLADAIQKRIEDHIAALEVDATLGTHADFGTNLDDIKGSVETKTAKTIKQVDEAITGRSKISATAMTKGVQDEIDAIDAKISGYDILADKRKVAGYKVANEAKAFRDQFDGTKATSLVAQSKNLSAVETGLGHFKTNVTSLIDGLNTGRITKMDASEVKEVLEFIKKIQALPVARDAAFDAKLAAAISAGDLTTLRDAVEKIELDKVEEEAKIEDNKTKLREQVKTSVQKGFLAYMPGKQAELVAKLGTDASVYDIVEEVAKLPSSPEFKSTLAAVKQMETESTGKSKDDYIDELRSKKSEAKERMGVWDTMRKYDPSISRARADEKPQVDLAGLGLVAESDINVGYTSTLFDYTKKVGDSYSEVDVRDEELEDDTIDEMTENIWEDMGDSQRNAMIAHTEQHPPLGMTIPERRFGEGVREFFAHLVGRQTRREQQLEAYTKAAIKLQIEKQSQKAYTDEQIEAPKREENAKAYDARTVFTKSYQKSILEQAVDAGGSYDKKTAEKKAVDKATKDVADEGR